MGGSNELVIYNLIDKIDDKFIACNMSYFTDSVNYPELPPLIAKVMKLK